MTWPKGVSGNPAGRPVGSKSFTNKVRDALEKIADGKEYSYEEALVKSILKKAIVDGDAGSQRLIWNYLDGMPQQSTDITSGGDPLPIIPLNVQRNNRNKKDIEDESED